MVTIVIIGIKHNYLKEPTYPWGIWQLKGYTWMPLLRTISSADVNKRVKGENLRGWWLMSSLLTKEEYVCR